MQVAASSNMPREPTERSNQVPHVGGGRIAFETSELTDEDVEALKQQGLTPMEQNEEGYTVFMYDLEEQEEEDDEEEDDSDDKEESSVDFRGRKIPSKNLDDSWQDGHVLGISKLPGKEVIKCSLAVKTACDLSDPKHVKHLMKLDFLKLELPNCVNDENHRGHFVHCIIIEVTPTEECRTKINRMYAMPSDDSQPKGYTNEASHSTGGAVSITPPWSVGIQASRLASKGLIITSTGESEWASAEVDDSQDSWSVTWTWNFLRWNDGQSFNQNKPWKVQGLPKVTGLPRLSLSMVEHNWAEWSTSSDLKGNLEKMEWDVKVKFCTVSLKRRVFKLSTISKYGYECARFGPEQITPIERKISGVIISSVSYPYLL